MNAITKFSMKNVGLIFIMILLIFGGGAYAVSTMKMEQFPNVDIPYLNVQIIYPGAGPNQVLADVAKPLEQQLSAVKDVKNLYVTAVANAAYATLEFEMTKSMDDAEQDVEAALSKVKLPDDALDPELQKQGPNAEAIYTFAVDGGGADRATVQQYVEEKLKPTLATVEGVSKVEIDGTSEQKLFVKVDPDKLKEHKMTLDQVKQALLANNISAPTGQITVDGKSMNVQVGKQLTSLDEVKNVNLILVEQNMSGLTDAFKQVGDGMNQLGNGMNQLGQGVNQMGEGMSAMGQTIGTLGQGQAILQQQIAVMAQINALSQQLLVDQAQQQMLQYDPTVQTDPAKQQQAAELDAKIKGAQAKIAELQGTVQKLMEQMKATGEEGQKLMAGLAAAGGQQPAAQPSSGNGGSTVEKPNADNAKVDLKVSTLKLADIAEVTYGIDSEGSYTRLNGKPAVVVGILPSIGANTVDIVKNVKAKLDAANMPDGYQVTKLRDESVEIKKSVDSMLREAVFGALLAALVTLAFLRNLRSTIVALLSIPLSILVTMFVLEQMGYSLNMLTLAGIAVAVGRVVDDSIVVIENIYRRLQLVKEQEERNANLVLLATKEVGSAITSSTLTTIAVFAPLAFVPGIVGKFFQPFAWTVVIALAFSLLISITVVPLMSRLFLLNLKPALHKEGTLQRGYKKLLIWSLGHKSIVVGLSVVMLAGTAFLGLEIPRNFFPEEKTLNYTLQIGLPTGTSLERSNDVATQAEQLIHDTGAVVNYNTTVYPGSVRIRVELQEGSDTAQFEETVRAQTKNFGDEVKATLQSKSGITGTGDLLMIINGPDLDSIKQTAAEMKKAIEGVSGVADVRTNVEGVRPEVTVQVDDAKAAAQGVNPAMILGAVRDMISGSTVTNVQLEGKTTELNLGLKVDALNSLDKVSEQTISNVAGQRVKIGDIAKVEQQTGATSVQRLNQQEYVSVTGKVIDSNTSGVQELVDKAAAEVALPDGVSYYFEGASKAMDEGFTNMAVAIGVSIILVYMVMMVAFGEMLAPLAILFSLPFIFVGAILGLYLTGESLGMPAMVGVLMLIGIVVTNAIVLIDRVMSNRSERGMSTFDALVEAGTTRIRPILMTAVATVGALIPLAISSDGGLISRSLAIVVISGLTTSTLLTLLIVPIAYTVLDNIRTALFGKKRKAPLVKPEMKEVL